MSFTPLLTAAAIDVKVAALRAELVAAGVLSATSAPVVPASPLAPTPTPTPVVLPAITASPIAPTSVIGFTLGTGNAAIALLSAVPSGATRSLSPNDGRVVLDSSGTHLIVGMTAATAGTISYTITDTLSGSASVSLVVPVVVSAAQLAQATAPTGPAPAITIPGAGQLPNQRVGLLQPALFVSPTGSDSNPGTQSAPLKTAAAAQTAMRAQGVKTVYFRDGVYPLTATLQISESDSGTNWLGFPGEKPIFDGGGTTVGGFLLQYYTTGAKVDHLTFRNFSTNGIWIHGGNGAGAVGNTISNNEVYNISIPNIAGGAGNSGGILLTYNTQGNVVTHNFVHDTQTAGISMAAGSTGESIKGNAITFNKVWRTNSSGQLDSGGVYALDRTAAQSGCIIAYNDVRDTSKNASGGGPGNGCDNTKGIYADDMASGFTIAYNIISGNEAMAIQYHGGTNNKVYGNILDVSQTMLGILYQDDTEFGGTTMSGNTFTGNIVYTSTAYNGNVGQAGQPGLWTVGFVSTLIKPSVSGNIYWNTTNTTTPFPNSGAVDVIDLSPHVVNPNFANPALYDYSFTDGGAAMAAFGFAPIDQTIIGPNVQSIGAAQASLSGIPSASTVGADISGSVVLTYIQTAYAALYVGGADEGACVAFQGGTLPKLQAQTSSPQYEYHVYDAMVGGNLLAKFGPISVGGPVATATLSNVTTTVSVGGTVSGTVALRYTSTAYAVLASGGADIGSRVAVSNGAQLALTAPSIAVDTVRVWDAATGGTLLVESGAINVHAVGAVPSPAFFIAPTGSDANPGTQAAPFLTFEAALAAMQGSTTKLTLARGGLYPRTASIKFNDSSNTAIGGPGPKTHDNGVTFMRFPGEVPVVDGGGSVTDLWFLDYHTQRVTIQGFEIRNCLNSGVHLNGYRTATDEGTILGCVVQDNYIHDIANGVSNVGAGNTGGVRGSFATRNNIVRNNRIENTFGPAVSFVAGGTNETIAGNQMLNNICRNNNQSGQPDTGALYILDRGHNAISTDQVIISNNYVENPGGGAATKGIYLDDHSSYVTVSNNIVRGVMKNSMQLHGGDHVTFSGNIFDISGTAEQPFYAQEAVLSAGPTNFGMGSDAFTGNIIYCATSWHGGDLWLFETDGQVIALPAVSNNLYFCTAGPLPNTGAVVDASPKSVNPNFTNASIGDYSFTDGGAAVAAAIGFSPINQNALGPQ